MNKENTAKELTKVSTHKGKENITKRINSRKRTDLVVAICGQLGSGTSTVSKEIKSIFESFNYTVYTVKLSKIIQEERSVTTKGLSKLQRIKELQENGNYMRLNYSHSVLAEFAVKQVHTYRAGADTDRDIDDERFVVLIDSIKHPDEYDLLNLVYGNSFFQIGVLCPENQRKQRLIVNADATPEIATKLIEKDKKENKPHGQKTINALYQSDFFLYNEKDNISNIRTKLNRFISLIMSDITITPTVEEYAMFLAQGSALRSGCLSRQVGAAILDEHNEIIATGRNDVPKFGGGLYCENDLTNDNRCIHRYNSGCKNTEYKNAIKDEIISTISDYIKTGLNIEEIADNLFKIDKIKNLTEFSRSIHAEMDAITTAARTGNKSLKNAKLFCTTYPCHNCARHIVASGISTVYYIEPYEKSLALKLHDDSIEFDAAYSYNGKKLKIIPFEGVSPKKYIDLFVAEDRKKKQKEPIDRTEVSPAIANLKESVELYEKVVIDNMVDREIIPAPQKPK